MKVKSLFLVLLYGVLWLMSSWAVAAEGVPALTPLPVSATMPVGKRVALVIGNDSYQKIKGLVNARADARAMAIALEKLGFDVVLATDVNQKAMLEAVRRFKVKLSGGDDALFYFSGHGVQLATGNYLLPVDITTESEDQIRDDALPLQRVMEDLQEQKPRFSLAIVDACRDDPFKLGNGRSLSSRGLAATSPATGQMVIYSAGTGQKALDKLTDQDKNNNGLFTRIFLQEMEKPNVPIGQVLHNVRVQVAELAKSVGQEQVPALFDQSIGTFYFNQVAVPDIKPVEVAAPVAPTSAMGSPPMVLANVPQSVAGTFSLEDIKQREASQLKWQAEMKAAFDETLAFNAAPRLQVIAWQRFLSAYAQDNPYSEEDKILRAQAEAHKQIAEKRVRDGQAAQVAALQSVATAAAPPVASPPVVATAPMVAAPVMSPTVPAVMASEPVVVPSLVVAQATPVVAPQAMEQPVVSPLIAAPAPQPVVAGALPVGMERVQANASGTGFEVVNAPPVVVAMAQTTEAVRPVENAQRILDSFRDCPDCAEMVVVAAGRFVMGSSLSEEGHYINEVQREVDIQHSFAIGKYEVTFAEWDMCVAAGGCGGYRPDDEGWGRGKQPVMQISWEDAQSYVTWLSQKTGKFYRLPTDVEWEYAARAGSSTSYPWGEKASHNQANYGTDACCAGFVGEKDLWEGTSPVGSFPANAFGLHDMQGNVWEWVQDCSDAACTQRVLRGGSWNSYPRLLRSANRNENVITKRPTNYGFRVARTLP